MTMLDDVKYGIGILPSNDGFDDELLMHMNSVGATLVQHGVDEFDLDIDNQTDWPTLGNQQIKALVKQYFIVKVKLVFDPSASETINKSLEGIIPELEGRIGLIVEELTP